MRLALLLVLLLAGCASNQSMTAEQITAASKDKSTSCVYAKIVGVWGTAETTVVGYDQRTISNGGIAIGDKCSSLSVSDTKPPAETKPVTPPKVTP